MFCENARAHKKKLSVASTEVTIFAEWPDI